MTQYTYSDGTDGCDSTFDVYDPADRFLLSINYWEARVEAESLALLIVNALNAFDHTDPKRMTTDQLRKHVYSLYCRYCRYMAAEAVERGYNAAAANEAFRVYSEAKDELDRREPTILEIAEELKQACDELVAGSLKP